MLPTHSFDQGSPVSGRLQGQQHLNSSMIRSQSVRKCPTYQSLGKEPVKHLLDNRGVKPTGEVLILVVNLEDLSPGWGLFPMGETE